MHTDIIKLVNATYSKKRTHAHIHIGRSVTDDEWYEVVRIRKIAKAKREERSQRQRRAVMLPAHIRLEKRRADDARLAGYEKECERYQQAADEKVRIRETLKRAARVARKYGYDVRKSTDARGRVSSYYVTRENKQPVRISDHYLPMTTQRQCNHDYYGGSPFSGEIIIDSVMSECRIRRLLVLAENGRV